MKDQTIKEDEYVSNSYLSRKGLTYEELGTKAEDWHPARIIGFESPKQPIYYKGDYDAKELFTKANSRFRDVGCELCGYSNIIYRHIIINKEIKQYMVVGSECINQLYGKVVRKKYKEFKDNETRGEAIVFLMKFVEWADTQKAHKYPKNNFEAGRLKYEVYLEKNKAVNMINKFQSTGIRKLQNFMKKHKGFENIPPVEQCQEEYEIKGPAELVNFYEKGVKDVKVGFGKYKDMHVKDVKESYIEWCKKEIEK